MAVSREVAAYLKQIYYDPKHPSSFGSVKKLYNAVNEKKGLKVNLKQVKKWLQTQDAYTVHKPVRKKFRRNRVKVYGMDSQWEADLVDISSHSRQNKGYRFLLTVIDVLSKYSWVIPLKDKKGLTLVKAFKKILSQGRIPVTLHTDKGTEFKNKHFQKLLKDNEIHYFTPNNEIKCSIIERFNRSLRGRMEKYFTSKNTTKYIDILPKLVLGYNETKHRSIGTSPASVTIQNQMDIKRKLYGDDDDKPMPRFKFKEGDQVRLSKTKMLFEKGYKPNWTEEIFVIYQRVHRNHPVYRVKDLNGETLEGTFYEAELQKVTKDNDDLYIIDRVLKRRKRKGKTEYLVSWRSYPDQFNSWVSDIQIGSI